MHQMRSMMIVSILGLAMFSAPKARAGLTGAHGIERVLLISIDGMHALDYRNCTVLGICPNLAALGNTGVKYLVTSTSKPSDSFPGLTAIVSGGSPRTEGVFYDVAYDRALDPPSETTGNGVIGAPALCTPGATPTGTRTEYEEGIDYDQSHLNGIDSNPSTSGDGGIKSIKPTRLPRNPARNCGPVYPWNYVRTNTIFGVIHDVGGYTAWSDKHPSYASVAGPSDNAEKIDDYFSPEINSDSANYSERDIDPSGVVAACSPNLPDQAAVAAHADYTGSFQNIQCYDALKVQAILNEIDGKTHNGSADAPVPNLFGMNFQSVSVGQKLVYQYGSLPKTYSTTGGYLDARGIPSKTLVHEIEFVDHSIGLMVAELTKRNLLNSTLIVISAKHGQSPIDPHRVLRIDGDVKSIGKSPATILASFLPDSEVNQIGPTEDDVSLLWLSDPSRSNVKSAVAQLESASPPLPLGSNIAGIGEIFWGASLTTQFNAPSGVPHGDPRTPDIIVTTDVGVIYTGHPAKVAEHGGFANDDTNVMMLASNPNFAAQIVKSPVETIQIAPTILAVLGLDPGKLQAVQIEGTQVLPSANF